MSFKGIWHFIHPGLEKYTGEKRASISEKHLGGFA